MRVRNKIAVLWLLAMLTSAAISAQKAVRQLDFFGKTVEVPAVLETPSFPVEVSEETLKQYFQASTAKALEPYLAVLLQYRSEYQPDDWLYYQLIRKVAQFISPKTENYYRYTFYKWWLLVQSGYDARLTLAVPYLLFYVQCDESIYNIPTRLMAERQYVCLNYHDYGNIDFEKFRFADATPAVAANAKPFTYKVSRLPDFRSSDYAEKEVAFSDGANRYAFQIKLNPQLKTLFTNYPVVDYDLQFNMPLSRPTYESLIPTLKKQVQGLKQREGVEFLMRFTRYAFLFKPDGEVFGDEKRLSPEQTLLSEFSDCEDRAALFFFLVKEVYNLPMLVLTYPEHVTVAVQFEKPYGKTVEHNGAKYSICEPSPQRADLKVGQLLPEYAKKDFTVAYVYQPSKH